MDKDLDKNYIRGNKAFVAEKYLDAINYYSQSLSAKSPIDPDVLLSRSHAFIKAEKYVEAKKDAEEVISLSPSDVKAYLRSGIASFHLGSYEEAKKAFSQGLSLDPNDSGLKQWKVWCEEKIKKMGPTQVKTQEKPPLASAAEKIVPTSAASTATTQSNTTAGPQVTHGWYQTASSVVVEVRIKNLNGEDLKIEYRPTSFNFIAQLPCGNEYSKQFNLCHPIEPDQSSYRILSTKVEINLTKLEGAHWPQLEGDGKSAIPSVVLSEEIKKMPPSYPTSSGKDWNKLEKELSKDAEEKLEGDAELNALFKKIYQDGNDDVRKAMNKSFTESGGTVLSTNWKDIKKDKVDVKPPEGMEFKSWEG